MEKRKLIDSNKNVSLGGRADKFAKEFYFQPKTGTKKTSNSQFRHRPC